MFDKRKKGYITMDDFVAFAEAGQAVDDEDAGHFVEDVSVLHTMPCLLASLIFASLLPCTVALPSFHVTDGTSLMPSRRKMKNVVHLATNLPLPSPRMLIVTGTHVHHLTSSLLRHSLGTSMSILSPLLIAAAVMMRPLFLI